MFFPVLLIPYTYVLLAQGLFLGISKIAIFVNIKEVDNKLVEALLAYVSTDVFQERLANLSLDPGAYQMMGTVFILR